MIEFITILLLGTIYGLIIGIVPTAGATTGLIIIFSFLHLFPDPYLAVVFCMATVGASTTGDSYAGVLLGIPGATVQLQLCWTDTHLQNKEELILRYHLQLSLLQ